METCPIGSLTVSVVGIGCNNFGMRIDEAATANVVHAALEAGINFFDTADIYGGSKSEEFLGSALKQRRDEAIIATKFGMKVNDAMQGGAKPAYIQKAVEDSLRRLGTDRIDLYQIHRPDPETPLADTLGTLNALVQAGKVREIGCSNFSVEQLQDAETAAKNGAKFVSVQNQYSLLNREAEKGVLAECARQGLAFLPFFPLANGLLTGKYRKGQPPPEGSRLVSNEHFKPWLSEENLNQVEPLIAFAESRGHTILELAFSWLLARPVVASVIAGATGAEQVKSNAAAANWKLSEEELAEVEKILARPE